MNITITGNLGAGKTSVCKELAKMGFEIISTGTIFRELAAAHNMSVVDFNAYVNELTAKGDRQIDNKIDDRTRQLNSTKDNVVFDSRLAWHFAEGSFKVFLLIDTAEAARRVYEGDSRSAEEYSSMDEAAAKLTERAQLEVKRFKDIYGINYMDASNYNLIIETACAAPDEIAAEIVRNFKLYQEAPFTGKLELNLKNICVSEPFRDFSVQMFDEIRNTEHDNDTLCALHSVDIEYKGGSAYAVPNGSSANSVGTEIISALAAGKVFVCADSVKCGDGSVPLEF